MKHQYFGDVNDFRKYGLLRALSSQAGLRLDVCWMLTPDDERSDGRFTSYLSQPALWRHHDAGLYDALVNALREHRHVGQFTQHAIVPGSVCFDDQVPDGRDDRAASFVNASRYLAAAELVFFDPDNGRQIKSKQIGRAHV